MNLLLKIVFYFCIRISRNGEACRRATRNRRNSNDLLGAESTQVSREKIISCRMLFCAGILHISFYKKLVDAVNVAADVIGG